MIYYDRETEILTMDLHDLEHCGFDRQSMDDQLFLDGINDPGARWPARLVVLFGEGAFDGPPSPIRGQFSRAADTHLVAAAPELYKACRRLKHIVEGIGIHDVHPTAAEYEEAVGLAGRALAKARGEDGDA